MFVNILLSVAFVLCWSSGFIGAKLGAGNASAITVLMWRFLPLAVVLVAVAAVTRTAWRGLTARDVTRQAVIGVLSQSGYLLAVGAYPGRMPGPWARASASRSGCSLGGWARACRS
jgi:hypothetical protein